MDKRKKHTNTHRQAETIRPAIDTVVAVVGNLMHLNNMQSELAIFSLHNGLVNR